MSWAISKDGDRYRATGFISINRNGRTWKQEDIKVWGDSEEEVFLKYQAKASKWFMQWKMPVKKSHKHKRVALKGLEGE